MGDKTYIERNKTIRTGETVQVNERHRGPKETPYKESMSGKARYQKSHTRHERVRSLPRIARGTVPESIT